MAARSWYIRVLDADPRNDEIQSLLAGLDADDALAPDVEATTALPAPAPDGLGIEIEKESSPFYRTPTAQTLARPFDEAQAREPADTPFGHLPTREFSPRPVIELSLADTAPAGVPIIPAATVAPAAEAELLDGLSLHGFGAATVRDVAEQHAEKAEGFESAEFAPPTDHVPLAELDASVESGVPSFSSPEHPIQMLDGLEGSGGQSHVSDAVPRGTLEDLEPLDLEGGLIIPREAEAPRAPSFDAPHPADDLLDFELAAPSAPAGEESWTDGGRRRGDDEYETVAEDEESVPAELPPEVIAAEAELITAGETPPPPAPDEDAQDSAVRPPFVTETMAELYLAQGFRAQALAVYTDLLAASPDDERLSGIVASLAPSPMPEHAGPNVRDFFARIANRRPGATAAAHEPPADDDFGPGDGWDGAPEVVAEPEALYVDPEREPESASEPAQVSADVPPAIERAAAMQHADGSIDALFGNRSAGNSEDSAAAALAQAFGGATDIAAPPAIPGRPARAAEGELSLDSVFRDAPARPARSSQSFSFDQFVAGAEDRAARSSPPRGTAVPVEAPTHPAERGADDIEQFNSWLQGLKQR